ncbi:uncharacterized protein LOC120115476 [Hibiscus syriacus]|uniref:uncharacterized protein LOC120115476 n=1 Tax=Hibiscus syriacus TaxID=106335 RepID=UPI001921828C|nr:uncharacterized protein LOC120115476 [Hibiscus syriacus]
MPSEVVNFFKRLLGSYDHNVKDCSTSLLKDLMLPIPTLKTMMASLRKSFVKRSKRQSSVKEMIRLQALTAFNDTTIALVPKILNPNKVSDFSPYFMSTIYNTLLDQEIMKGYGKKTISPRCALKIDLQEAFDSIHWSFIPSILKALAIPNIFIEWIEACYSAASYSVAFNESLIGYFKGAKGLKQGDPLSPILFVMVMNILSKLLNNATTKGIFSFHPKCKKIYLTHLTFADDLLIFCKVNLESLMGVTTVLDYF